MNRTLRVLLGLVAVWTFAGSLAHASEQDAEAARIEARRKARAMAGLPPDDPAEAGRTHAKAGAAAPALVPGFEPQAGGWPADAPKGFQKAVKVEGLDEPDALYHLFVPNEYTPQKEWPAALVLHGGPGGNAGNLVPTFAKRLTERGVLAIFPQALGNKVLLEWNYPHQVRYLRAIVQQIAQRYRLDPSRVYLMGHSMGGGGTWCQGALGKDVWAAIAPLSGWYAAMPRVSPDLYKDLPVYAIHGTADAQVPCSRTDLAEQEFKKLGKADFVYRRLDGVGHDVFTGQGEELDKLCDWLVKQKRAAPANWAGEEEQLVKYGRFFKWSPDGPLGKYAEEGGK
ncbi:MAG: dienelactone hydrolase family protein [Planctomycetota bacterium]|nr:dienelactone hydrolase family protein [Planctomycetota bacterium]